MVIIKSDKTYKSTVISKNQLIDSFSRKKVHSHMIRGNSVPMRVETGDTPSTDSDPCEIQRFFKTPFRPTTHKSAYKARIWIYLLLIKPHSLLSPTYSPNEHT